ncbi:MAG: hypothetical protein RLZZ447_1052, partial [Verrucomicrobiota bacterium]
MRLAALCLSLLALLPPSARAAAPAPERINVVFILADDLGWAELGSYGQKKIPTPHLDRLAAEGMRFTRHYSGAPVCAPSRCVLMTGRHLGRAEIRGNRQAKLSDPRWEEGQHPLSAEAVTIAQVFQQAGYATGAMGKWGLGPVGSTGDPNRKGFDLFFGYNCQAVAHSFFPSTLWRNAEKVPLNTKPVPGRARQPEGTVRLEDWQGEQYSSRAMVAEAEGFIRREAGRPFFLYLPFIEPHVAMHPPPEWVDRFPREWDPEPYRGESGYLPHPRPRAGYAAMIAMLDDHVGRVLAALEQAGVAGRTLVVFSSDNGTTHEGPKGTKFHVGGADPAFFASTGPLRGFKGSVYEGGLRVPMIARLPGRIPGGRVNAQPGYFADWFPTLCEAAGLRAPAGLDGESLWPALTSGRATPRRTPMVWVFPEYGGQVAVQLGDLKAVRRGLRTPQPGGWEVYDLTRDPGEAYNLAAERPELVRAAEDVLRREMQ